MRVEGVNIFGKRLRNARLMRGISMDKLSNLLNNSVSKMSISKYENGIMKPSSDVLINLADALNLSIDYFFRPFNYSVEHLNFRKYVSLPKKEEQKITQEIADFVERYLEIEDICSVETSFKPPFSEFVSSKEEVVDKAAQLREEWELGKDAIVSVYSLLEDFGIKVFEIDTSIKFDGLSAFINNNHPIIVLNKNFTSERKRFTAFHELAHLVLRFSPEISEKEQESCCHLFASEMLIPRDTFIKRVGAIRKEISDYELIEIQKEFGISCDALIYKAKSLGIINYNQYSFYFRKKNKHVENKELLNRSRYCMETSTRFKSLVYKAFSENIISDSKAASLLNIPFDQIHKGPSLE